MMQLTKNFSYEEFLVSDTAKEKGIDNTPDNISKSNIIEVLAPGMQRLRELLGTPVQTLSAFRSKELNKAVGGARDSQHLTGNACDFISPKYGTPKVIAQFLALNFNKVYFDQLIYEGTWVHISFVRSNPRGQVLTAIFNTGKPVVYVPGIV